MKTKGKRWHRLSALVAVLCIAAILASFGAFFASAGTYAPDYTEVTVGDWGLFLYPDDEQTGEKAVVCVCAYYGSDTRLVIPAEIGGYKIDCVGDYWGDQKSGFTGLACYQNNQICNDTISEVVIANGIKQIAWGAFCGDSEEDHSVYTNLQCVTIPESVTEIYGRSFCDCVNLNNINLPNNLMWIGIGTFYNTLYYNTSSNWSNGVLYLDNYILDAKADEVPSRYTILPGTKGIGEAAFEGCERLTQVTVPGSVTSIEAGAFGFCDSLTQVTILEGVMSIEAGAFEYCESLAQVTIPQSVTSIEDYAFGGCCDLTQVTIPRNVTSIGDNAFYDSGLTTIYGYSDSYAESYAKENGLAFIALAELHDTKSGITVAATAEDAFPESAELAVSVVDTANDRITYDISLQAGGKAIRPNGSVTVKIPVPETMDGANVKVYRQEADGTLTDMHAIFQDGYAVFTTDHFSRYILESKTESVQPTEPAEPTDPTQPTQPTQPTDPANPQSGQSGTTQAPANNAHTDIPKTGSASNALAGTCAFMLAIAAVGALGLKKAYRKKKAQA